MKNEERGTGQTTDQMRSAAKNAVFVWCASNLDYPRRLADSIGRSDLEIITPSQMHTRLCGRRVAEVVVDHAAELDICQLAAVLVRVPPNA